PAISRSWSGQVLKVLSVCSAKNSGPTLFGSSSQAVALAPFSQNSNRCGVAGFAHAQLTHMKPPGLFWWMSLGATRSGLWREVCLVTDFAEPQPPTGPRYSLMSIFLVM